MLGPVVPRLGLKKRPAALPSVSWSKTPLLTSSPMSLVVCETKSRYSFASAELGRGLEDSAGDRVPE